MQSTSSIFAHQKWQLWHWWHYYNHFYSNYDYYRYQYEPWMQRYHASDQSQNLNTALETISYLSETYRWDSNSTNIAMTAKQVKEQSHALLRQYPRASFKSNSKCIYGKNYVNFVLHSDQKLLETTPADILNDISILIGIESDFNYQNEMQKVSETNLLSENELQTHEKAIELPFLTELKFYYFGTYDQNGPFIPETTDQNRAHKLKKTKFQSQKLNGSEKTQKANNSVLNKTEVKVNLKEDKGNERKITDRSATENSNESKEVAKHEKNVTLRRFSERLRKKLQI